MKNNKSGLVVQIFWLFSMLILVGLPPLLAAKPKMSEKPALFEELPRFKVDEGRLLYQRFCAFCHGESGQGNGPNSFNLSTKPFPFVDKGKRNQIEEKALLDVLRNGGGDVGKSNEMPAFEKTLNQKQIKKLIQFLRKGFYP